MSTRIHTIRRFTFPPFHGIDSAELKRRYDREFKRLFVNNDPLECKTVNERELTFDSAHVTWSATIHVKGIGVVADAGDADEAKLQMEAIVMCMIPDDRPVDVKEAPTHYLANIRLVCKETCIHSHVDTTAVANCVKGRAAVKELCAGKSVEIRPNSNVRAIVKSNGHVMISTSLPLVQLTKNWIPWFRKYVPILPM